MRNHWVLAVALFATTLVVYAPTLHNGYVEYDDPGYVTANPHVPQGLTIDNVRWSFTTVEQGNWHPVAWLSYLLDAQLYGHDLAGFHATSIVLHCLNATILFLLLVSATGCRWRSFFVAALFALHPINVESVSWLSERKSLLSFFFTLLTIAAYGWYVRRPARLRYAAMVIAFAMALMSKSMAVSTPLVLLLLDYWPLRRFDRSSPDSRSTRQLLVEKIPLFGLSILAAVVAIYSQHHGGAISTLERIPLRIRLENAIISTVTYWRRLFWPSDLSYFYPHPGLNISMARVAAALIILVVVGIAIWRFRSHRPLVFGFAFFFVTVLPVIGIVQIGVQSMADRYAYVPFVGLFIALSWELADAANRLHFPPFARTVAATLIVGALAACTVQTEGYWRNSLTLFQRGEQMSPRPNLFIETNLAAALLDAGRTDEALQHFRLAESVAPGSFTAHYNIAVLLRGQRDFSGAAAEFDAAARCNTTGENRARALYALGNVYAESGRREQAIAAFRQILAVDPENAQVQQRIADLQK